MPADSRWPSGISALSHTIPIGRESINANHTAKSRPRLNLVMLGRSGSEFYYLYLKPALRLKPFQEPCLAVEQTFAGLPRNRA